MFGNTFFDHLRFTDDIAIRVGDILFLVAVVVVVTAQHFHYQLQHYAGNGRVSIVGADHFADDFVDDRGTDDIDFALQKRRQTLRLRLDVLVIADNVGD